MILFLDLISNLFKHGYFWWIGLWDVLGAEAASEYFLGAMKRSNYQPRLHTLFVCLEQSIVVFAGIFEPASALVQHAIDMVR